MAALDPTFLLGVVVLLYLCSFIVFAILRILTGLSIQRIGYFSLRRLAYAPREGIRIEIRGLGLNLHRPTFAQPTWLSVVVTELAVTVDLKALQKKEKNTDDNVGNSDGAQKERRPGLKSEASNGSSIPKFDNAETTRSKSWEHLMRLKERIKRIHRKINWIRMLDMVATNSSITIVDVGNLQVGSFTIAVDTRRRTVDRRRMFSHKKTDKSAQRPAEWILTVRSVLFTADGKDSLEVLDHATLNVHGMLYQELDGLRDASIALKLGRVHLPYDDLNSCYKVYHGYSFAESGKKSEGDTENYSVSDLASEVDRPGSSREDGLVQTVSDSKEFVSSILRGIKEVQFAVSYAAVTKVVESVRPGGHPIYLNASMKEVGIDLHRLDPKTPAHRMYFSPKDIAHQALVAALSIAVGVDDGNGQSERLIYIPMATTTVRTTLPSKTVEIVKDRSADERNANMLFANIVITSPSIDLDPKHLPLVLALMRPTQKSSTSTQMEKHGLLPRLLPKANVKFSMHEPVIRIALPAVDPSAEADDFDLLISSISSISFDAESSHSPTGELHYSLASTFRLQSHELYYQTSSAARYDLLQTESLELKVLVNANPEVCVAITGNLQTFSVRMVRPEISDGVRQIVRQLRYNIEPEKKVHAKAVRDPNFIRALPPWLLHVQLQASDFSAEVAGVDSDISEETRGVALQLESWTAEYRAQRLSTSERRPSRRRNASRSMTPDVELLQNVSKTSRKKYNHPTDGRRLAVHVRGLDAFVVESEDRWEAEPFVSVPRLEVALSTLTDQQGPVLHVHSHVRSVLIQYSLYRHYAIGVAALVVRKAFVRTKADQVQAEGARAAAQKYGAQDHLSPLNSPQDYYSQGAPGYPFTTKELVTIDVKASLLQVKATMPADPPMMLQIYGMEAGRHRWSAPFWRSKLTRLYAEAPRIKSVWARILSIKHPRVDLRDSKRKLHNGQYIEESTVDVSAEAIRLAIPHQLILHRIFDNVVNVMKATEQLHHRFQTGTNEYILEKKPQGPKNLPRISIRTRALLLELEDGAFEWKLGLIYRTGLIEQQQRLARDQAFEVKARKIEEDERRRDPSRYRNRSSHPRGRSKPQESSNSRSKSEDGIRSRERPRSNDRSRKLRYDPDGTCGLSAKAKISIDEARDRLRLHNAQSWKKRIDHSYVAQTNAMKDLRGVFWGPDQLPPDMEETEDILEVPQRPALMATLISDLHIVIDKPSFPLSQLPEFMNRVGKGMPLDTKYSLLVPMHLNIDMGEARMTLRDYPLPLLHVPSIKPGQSSRLPAWSIATDFVIGEEYRGSESSRHVKVEIVPPRISEADGVKNGGFAIDVRRTVAPVKSYSEIAININTAYPTRITWGASYQSAIQDMMMVIETFTKPQVDPSDRTGFWDKIRLSFHSRVSVAWKGDGSVHLSLKGTRDPYVVTGNGAGFLMCWRNDVRWNIRRDDDPRKFMTVDSGEYVLAIPDYSQQANPTVSSGRDDESSYSGESYKNGVMFKKVVMKLSGNVQWMAGLMFERNLDNGKRSFESTPHYQVVLKEPQYAKAPPGEKYDAYRGFRSHHIHMSIAVKAPVDRDWSVTNSTPSRSYNTVHLTPRFFTHFFAWWSMFGGTMSLPIRQGRLWPGMEKSSKKFGRHLATIKYNLLLAPLFLSHIYKHKDAEDYSENVVSATGLKIKLDSFMLDVHQRREQFQIRDKSKKSQGKTSGMKMHRAQLDLLSADVRAVSASIAGTTPDDLKKSLAPMVVSQDDMGAVDLSKFVISDNDLSWIDMDDFVELDWILPTTGTPDTKIMPLAYAPRFTYFRQTDHGDTISGDPTRSSPFGNEPTHFCIMSQDDDPRRVQCQLIQERVNEVDQQTIENRRRMGDLELNIVKDEANSPSLRSDYDQLAHHDDILQDKKAFLETMLHRMELRIHTNIYSAVPNGDPSRDSDGDTTSPENCNDEADATNSNSGKELISDFNNRFVIHNMQLKWNNSLRNVILRYIHQVSQRRGFVYYLSRRAVKFILDIVDEQNKAKASKSDSHQNSQTPSTSPDSDDEEAQNVEAIINDILADGKKTVDANDPEDQVEAALVDPEDLVSNISKEFTPQNSYHLRLVAPQIQLQSEKNKKSVVLVTAKGMELKVIEVMDKERMFDNVSGLVQRRFSVEMDSTQFFVTQQKRLSNHIQSMYSGGSYGTAAGSAWPPWVPMEVMFDFRIDPFGFKRVVQKTSASLRYDKYNTLRLKYNDEVSGGEKHAKTPEDIESRMDHLWVDFPQIRAICDSAQYYAIYIIVLDLLLYSEPLEKVRSERLEKIMLASDFSDLRGAPEMVIKLQERIRSLEEIKTQFQIHSKFLDKEGWEDRIILEQDLTSCEDELFFMMKAITTSQRKYDGSQSSGLLQWSISSDQIVWHLMRDKDQPLVEFQLENAEYKRTDNSDGSHLNLMSIGRIVGLNLLPDAIYPEIIAPYVDTEKGTETTQQEMLRVYWRMLEAIAGIPVMDHFEVNLFPMKIQLEREVGKRIFEYIFPGSGDRGPGNEKNHSPLMVKHMQPLLDEDEEDDAAASSSTSVIVSDADKRNAELGTQAGSLELRLKPTMTSENRPSSSSGHRAKASNSDTHYFRLLQSNPAKRSMSSGPPSIRTMNRKTSLESLKTSSTPRPGIARTLTMASMDAGPGEGKTKRFGFGKNGKSHDNEKPADDLTKMMSRASNYMTLAYIKIPSVVLCLSYKGKGERNIEDVHDFVFRMPMLEYRNKTWSNLDLALALKKDVIKALISHTGAIIGNKFSRHRPNQAQQTRLRELATSSMLLAPSSQDTSYDNSDAEDSVPTSSPTDAAARRSERSKSPRRSFASSTTTTTTTNTHTTGVSRSGSGRSSTKSLHFSGRAQSFPANMRMTPATPIEPSSPSSATPMPERRPVDAGGAEESMAAAISRQMSRSTATSVNGDGEPKGGGGGGGFKATAVGRRLTAIGDKIRDREAGASTSAGVPPPQPQQQQGEETEENGGRRKSKLLLGRKILGGLGDH